MVKQGQTQINLMFGFTVLLIGGILLVFWAFGEALPSIPLTAIGKWGLGILIIAIEIIHTIIKGGFK
ncbi:hypothetical protein HY498_01710 [Candidatus Woesearchaeota archaeon]|nr:hypothetical protein [Candidatus Woesearchaeota archaeon]